MNKKKNRYLTTFATVLLSASMLTLTVSCGSDDDDDNGGGVQQQQETQEGTFRAVLVPVNPAADDDVSGTATVILDGDNFSVEVDMANAPTGTHMQHIHVGTRCPTSADDANADGYVDPVEASAVRGNVLVPLDSELSAQALGSNNYPSGTNYNYREDSSFSATLADLRLPDVDTTDAIDKLGPDEEIDLEGRVVEVHGVPVSMALPGTVTSGDTNSPHSTLSIACGVLTRVTDEQAPDEQTPDEQAPDEQTPDEQTPDEQTPDEQAPPFPGN